MDVIKCSAFREAVLSTWGSHVWVWVICLKSHFDSRETWEKVLWCEPADRMSPPVMANGTSLIGYPYGNSAIQQDYDSTQTIQAPSSCLYFHSSNDCSAARWLTVASLYWCFVELRFTTHGTLLMLSARLYCGYHVIFSCELGQMWGMWTILKINMLIFFECEYFSLSLHDGILSFSVFVHTHMHIVSLHSVLFRNALFT